LSSYAHKDIINSDPNSHYQEHNDSLVDDNDYPYDISIALLDRPDLPSSRLTKPCGFIPYCEPSSLNDEKAHQYVNINSPTDPRSPSMSTSDSKTNLNGTSKIPFENEIVDKEEVMPLPETKVIYVDIKGAKKFLSPSSSEEIYTQLEEKSEKHHEKTTYQQKLLYQRIILVAVKQYDIIRALTPLKIHGILNCKQQRSPVHIILLHNGLRDKQTEKWLDQTFLIDDYIASNNTLDHSFHVKARTKRSKERQRVVIMNMVTSAGGTLLTKKEIENKGIHDCYDCVVRATGRGNAFIFPRYPNEDTNFNALSLLARMIPQCKVLSYEDGRCEQILKLAVNVALNGTLAKMALRDWYLHHMKQISASKHDHITKCEKWDGNIESKKRTSAKLVRRVVNQEMMDKLPLAKAIARLVLKSACKAEPFVKSLQKANEADEAFHRTEITLHQVPQNCCSTVVDICSLRRTEGSALLHTVVHEWAQHFDNDDDDPFVHSVVQELKSIESMLSTWDSDH